MAEKEYIEREAVLNDIGELFTLCRETLPNEAGHHFIVEKELETHLDFVRNLPAADVRPVVLCKDCKWCHAGYCEKFDDIIPWGVADRPWEDWFCACGEKRKES